MWALAVTAPQCEHLVCRDLRDKLKVPFHFFLQNKRVVHRGRVIERAFPAFPSYVMVPLEAAWDVGRLIWRVIGFVRFGEQIAPVPQAEIDRLLARCEGGNVLPVTEVPEPFRLGERVHVGGYGAMSGHDGIYQHRVDNGKLCVLFDWMGRWTPIDIDERDVSGVSATVGEGKARKKKRKHRSRRKHRPQTLSA